MLMLNHAAIGAVIGSLVPNPALAFLAGFVSHFAVDIIPHGDSHHYPDFLKRRHVAWPVGIVIFDVVGTVALVAILFLKREFISPLAIILGITGSLLPDIIVALHEGLPTIITKHLSKFHFWNHDLVARRLRDLATIPGLLIQLVVFLLFIQAL